MTVLHELRWWWPWLLLAIGLSGSAVPAEAQAQALAAGFRSERVVAGLQVPTAFARLPDGRILIAEKQGTVRVLKNGVLLDTPFIDLRSRVNDYWDRGLIGLAADPDFATNGHVYLAYVYEHDATRYDAPKTSRLTRVTATGDTASPTSEVVLLGTVSGDSCSTLPETADCIPVDEAGHAVGAIRVAPDGTLFVTFGDGAGFSRVDPRAIRAQHVDALGGKVLRLSRTGQGLPDNPFWNGNPASNRSKVWAYGLRNAFRFGLRPVTGIPYLGDVGWGLWEEVNVGRAGANFGWPCYEGPDVQSGYEGLAECQALYAQGPSAVQPALVAYAHNGGGASVTGGAFYTGTAFPEAYRGAYFFGDYALDRMWTLRTDANDTIVGGVQSFGDGLGGPVDIQTDGDDLLYLAIVTGELRRIRAVSTLWVDGASSLADATPTLATNGWGPYERDYSNGEAAAGDGGPLRLNGITYARGLGVHAPSDLRFHLNSQCTAFSAVVGVDDEVGANGSVQFEVWADGARLFRSAVLTGTSAPLPVSVDLTGRQELRLVVTDGGNGISADHADWADAQVTCGSSSPTRVTRALADLTWTSATNGWGPVERDRSNGEAAVGDGATLTLNGVTYARGLGAHAASDIRYALGGQCLSFAADVGVDDEVGSNGSVGFEVWVDGTRRTASSVLTGSSATATLTADLTGAQELRLVMTDGGDGVAADHGDWADARVTCDTALAPPPADGPAFTAPADLPSGLNTHSVTAADVDRDGVPDLIAANSGSSTVTVFRGLGQGQFASAVSYAVGVAPKSAAVTDLNLDGWPDLVVVSQNDARLTVLRNDSGTFRAAGAYAVSAGAHEAAAGDLNGDGRPDVVTVGWGAPVLNVLLGRGDGTLVDAVTYPVGDVPNSVVVADLNGDGQSDVATTAHGSNAISVLLGRGDGTLGPEQRLAAGTGPHSIRAGDLNGDGRMDLVTANDGSDDVSIFLGRADGTLAPQVRYPTGPVPKGVALGDVDGDGHVDVVTANTAGNYPTCCNPGGDTVSLLRGTGAGGVRTPLAYTMGTTPFAVSLADLNGDGRRDLATGNWHGQSVTVRLQQAAPTVNQPPVVTITSPLPTLRFRVGQTIAYAGSAVDPEDGALLPSALSWEVVVWHCPGGVCHTHILWSSTGAEGSLTAPDHGDDSYLVFTLTATDRQGLRRSASVEVHPLTVRVTLATSPAGLEVTFGGLTQVAPATFTTVAGSVATLNVASTQGIWTFDRWSDGGSRQHDIAVGDTDVTYTATFVALSATGTPRPVSALPFVSSANGWGPVERDRSNGESAAGDGGPITLNGMVFARGLGVHAASDVRVALDGRCSAVDALVGVDDEVATRGSVVFQIWADGVLLADSGVRLGDSPTRRVSASLTGRQQLSLVVTDAGDGATADHGDWAEATVTCTDPPPPPQTVTRYVSDLAWTSAVNGLGPVERDRANGGSAAGDGGPITLNGVRFARGLGTHAVSDVRVPLGGACTRFEASVGIDDAVQQKGSAVFQVLTDGVLLYDSGLMKGPTATRTVRVDVTGRAELRLRVTDGGNGNTSDLADWADARLTCLATTTP